jgi:hypothetical protein
MRSTSFVSLIALLGLVLTLGCIVVPEGHYYGPRYHYWGGDHYHYWHGMH